MKKNTADSIVALASIIFPVALLGGTIYLSFKAEKELCKKRKELADYKNNKIEEKKYYELIRSASYGNKKLSSTEDKVIAAKMLYDIFEMAINATDKETFDKNIENLDYEIEYLTLKPSSESIARLKYFDISTSEAVERERLKEIEKIERSRIEADKSGKIETARIVANAITDSTRYISTMPVRRQTATENTNN